MNVIVCALILRNNSNNLIYASRTQNAYKTVFCRRLGSVPSQLLSNVWLWFFFFFYWLVVWSKGVAHLTAPVYTPGSFTTINHSVCGGEGLSTLTESASTQAVRTFATARGKSPAAHYHRCTTLYCNIIFFFNQYSGPLGGLWRNCEPKYLRSKW